LSDQTLFDPQELRNSTLSEFCDAPDFNQNLHELLTWAGATIEKFNQDNFGNFKSTGASGLAVFIASKAGRVFNYVIRGKVGKGKLEDELDDLLIYTVYFCLYLRRWKKEKGGQSDRLGS